MNATFPSLTFCILFGMVARPAAGQVPDVLKLSIPLSLPGVPAGTELGSSVAVDGGFVVLGAPSDPTGGVASGSVAVFDAVSGAQLFRLMKPGAAEGDRFGYSVAVYGSRVVVGIPYDDAAGPDAGSVCVYDLASATPTVPAFTLNNPSAAAATDYFGYAVAIEGTRVVVGASNDESGGVNAGCVYGYDLGSATPTVPVAVVNNPSPAANDSFGVSVAISGTRVAVGAYADDTVGLDAGSVYVYDFSSTTPILTATLNNPKSSGAAFFGYAMGLSGSRVVVGSYLDDTGALNTGSAYVYDVAGATPTVPAFTLHNPSPGLFDRFGTAAAISGTRVVIGAHGDDTGGVDSGSAYLFDLASATPTVPVVTFNNPTPAVSDEFAYAVAVSGSRVVVGNHCDDTWGTDVGGACVYGPSPYSMWKALEAGDPFAPDLGDADGDGVSNLAEYGLLRSPTLPGGAPTAAASALYAEGARLRLFVPRDPARNDVTLEVQATGDLLLGPWTTIATSTLGAPFTGPGYFGGDSATPGVKSVEVRDTVNVNDAPQRYLRVRVRR